MMGPYYGLLKSCQGWLVDQGIDAAVAAKFTGAVFQGMAGDAAEASAVGGRTEARNRTFTRHIHDFATTI